jgi:hypothetical protein
MQVQVLQVQAQLVVSLELLLVSLLLVAVRR